MSPRAARRLAWSLVALATALNALNWLFGVLNRSTPETQFDPIYDVVLSVFIVAIGAAGALVVSRQTRNRIGWMLCTVAVPFALSGAAYGYATYALFTEPGGLPAADVMAWLSSWVFLPPLFGMPAFLLLLFPDGRLLSRRWRPVAWLGAVAIPALALGTALMPGRLEEAPFEGVQNPAGIDGAEGFFEALFMVGWLVILGILLGAVSLALRFRRARGEERLQLKWMAAAGVLFALAVLAASTLFAVDAPPEAGQTVILLAFGAIPLAAGLAILKYRLYDVDVVINRTLVYGSLTATLAASYLAVVLLLQLALSPLTEDSGLAVAGSTLAVAALFRPARGRIQGIVDRRFYRRRYDAARTLESFGAHLRDEVELDSLSAELRTVVADTMQPAHVSLWLRRAQP